MRQLYVLRGLPGSGKSTFVKNNGLEAYTIAPDDIRLVMSGPALDATGRMRMPMKDDAAVWKLLREVLEARMSRGELIVIDATHTLPSYFHDYYRLAQRYRYTTYAVDFGTVPLEVCKAQNKQRAPYKVVDEPILNKMYERLQQNPIPKQFRVLQPDAVAATLANNLTDLSAYRRIHHIGDIQGCFTPLESYFDTHPYAEDEYYIFVGDLLDRGSQNGEVLRYICEQWVDKPNVAFIEGNHEMHLWNWLINQPVRSREFNGRTREQLEAAGIDKAAVSRMFRNMRTAFAYTYGDERVLVSHGGLSTFPEQLAFVSADQYIHGAGRYEEIGAVDDAFVATTGSDSYQVHGHRNQQNYPTAYNERCFNLEGKVEFGGDLRVVQLSADGFTPADIGNQSSSLQLHPENAPLVHSLRQNRHISEHQLPGNISSFHFKSEVFWNKAWTKQTMTARGLFVNMLTNEIVIRAYDKFFNIGERRDTELPALQERLQFPVRAWVKENGYLGLLGYDAVSGELIFASKSTTEGEFAGWFRELFMRRFKAQAPAIKQYLADQNVCLVFEVILPRHDPHIIGYAEDDLVLLDIVKRQAAFEALPDSERDAFAGTHSMRTKRLAATLDDWDAFQAWYSGLKGLEYQFDGQHIEGFVIEDAAHFMVKAKLDFYSFWKQLRSALDAIKTGKQPKVKVECEYPELAAEIIAFMQSMPAHELAGLDIIGVRAKYLAAKQA